MRLFRVQTKLKGQLQIVARWVHVQYLSSSLPQLWHFHQTGTRWWPPSPSPPRSTAAARTRTRTTARRGSSQQAPRAAGSPCCSSSSWTPRRRRRGPALRRASARRRRRRFRLLGRAWFLCCVPGRRSWSCGRGCHSGSTSWPWCGYKSTGRICTAAFAADGEAR